MYTPIPDQMYRYFQPGIMTARQRKAAHFRAELAAMNARKQETEETVLTTNTSAQAHEAELIRAKNLVDAARFSS